MSKQWIQTVVFLSSLTAAFVVGSPADAESMQFDLGFMDRPFNQSRTARPFTQIPSWPTARGLGYSSATGSPTPPQNPLRKQGGNVAGVTRPQSLLLPAVETAILADGSVDPYPIPSGTFDYGFPKTGAELYRGPYRAGIRSNKTGSFLPQVSTSSVDINICDAGGSSGGGGGGNGGSGSSGGSQIPPNLPPGWAGVMCHGIYAGAIPPGGTVEAFWRGEYGFAGDEAQQAALLREGQWLLEHGQIGP